MNRGFEGEDIAETSSDEDFEDHSDSEEGSHPLLAGGRSFSEPADLNFLSQEEPHAQQQRHLRVNTCESQDDASEVSPLGHIDALTEDIGSKILAGKWPLSREGSYVSKDSSMQDQSPARSPVMPLTPWPNPRFSTQASPSQRGAERDAPPGMACARCHRALNQGEPAFLQRQLHVGQSLSQLQRQGRGSCKGLQAQFHSKDSWQKTALGPLQQNDMQDVRQQLQNARSTPMPLPFETPFSQVTQQEPRAELPLQWHIEHERRRLLGSPASRLASWPQYRSRQFATSSSSERSSEKQSERTSGSEEPKTHEHM